MPRVVRAGPLARQREAAIEAWGWIGVVDVRLDWERDQKRDHAILCVSASSGSRLRTGGASHWGRVTPERRFPKIIRCAKSGRGKGALEYVLWRLVNAV